MAQCVIIGADQEALMSLGGPLKSPLTCRQRPALIGLDGERLPDRGGASVARAYRDIKGVNPNEALGSIRMSEA